MLLMRVDEDPRPQFLLNSRLVKTFKPWPANPGENSYFRKF